MRVVVTGGLGFIGSTMIRWLFREIPEVEVINIDALTYAGCTDNVAAVAHSPRYHWIHGSIGDERALHALFNTTPIDLLLNFAAETHVDRSIVHPHAFVKTNVLGTEVLLELARHGNVERFIHISTDEVYGSLHETGGAFHEDSPLAPSSPYSASKAGADLLVLAYHRTYGQNVCITRCSNNYGPYQFPEKLIPLWITNGLDQLTWPVYGDGKNVRDWIYVEDHVAAVWAVACQGQPGAVYNIGSRNERSNLEVAESIRTRLGLPASIVVPVPDRPGHDRRYAIDPTRIERELGWRPTWTWEAGLDTTIEWYQRHQTWWRPLKAGRS